MRAVWLERFVQPGEIVVADVPMPEMGEGDVLVRVHASGVNPSDVKYAGGVVPTTPLPRIPGRDFAGVVERGQAELVGLEVYGTGGDLGIRRNGAHAEYLAVPIAAVTRKPVSLSMAQAAAVGVPYVTAFKAVVELAALQPGETILIVGGSGSVGQAAAQVAQWVGGRVIATTRRGEQTASLQRRADAIITLPTDDITTATMDATGGKGADVVFNVVGGETFEPGVNSLSAGGRMVCIAATGDHRVSFDLMTFYKKQMRWYGLDTLELPASECAPILDRLRPGFDNGSFEIEIAREFPLEQASEAYATVAKGSPGKIVLNMS
jgi:NADPH:quinone reductase